MAARDERVRGSYSRGELASLRRSRKTGALSKWRLHRTALGALRTIAGVVTLTASAACSDPTSPSSSRAPKVSGPHPDVLIDWYNCVSMDGGWSWTCEYTHTEWQSAGGSPYVPGPGTINNVPSNCQVNATYCENYFHGGGGGGGSGNAVPANEKLNTLGSGYCIVTNLCSPPESSGSTGGDDYCNNGGLSGLCTPGEQPPDAFPKLFAGRSSQLVNCPGPVGGFRTDRPTGVWDGQAATYFIGFRKVADFPDLGGQGHMAAYNGVVQVTTFMGPTRSYGFAVMVDCDDGSYVGVGIPRS